MKVTKETGSLKNLSWVETIYSGGPGLYARVTEWSHGGVDCLVYSPPADEMLDAWRGEGRTVKNAHTIARRHVGGRIGS